MVYFPCDSVNIEYIKIIDNVCHVELNEKTRLEVCHVVFPSNEQYFLKDHIVFGKDVTVSVIGKPTEHITNYGRFPDFDFDLIVIGGGSGGFQCAKKASKDGFKVALFNFVSPSPHGTEYGLGGTCVNAGCIPKKLFHIGGSHKSLMNDAKDFGWNLKPEEITHDWPKLQSSIQAYVSKLNWKHEGGLRNARVAYHHAFASFLDDHAIEAKYANGEIKKFTAKNICIATGSRPKSMGIKGEEHCITSDDLFYLTKSPGKTLIVGGGYIALETAGILATLNHDVTVSVRDKLLRDFDVESVSKVKTSLEKAGVKFLTSSHPKEVTKVDGRLIVQFESDKCEYDTVLLAVGRNPSLDRLGLSNIDVKPNNTARIDPKGLEKWGNIYAIGDAIHDRYQLTPVAIAEGKHVAMRLSGKSIKNIDYSMVPTTIFTPEEYGCCGLSEEHAISKYGSSDIEVYKKSVNVLDYQMGFQFSKHDQAFFKLVCVKSLGERIVGFHYVGPNAGEITVGISLAMKFSITKEDLDESIGIHPTLAEVVTQLERGVTKDTGC